MPVLYQLRNKQKCKRSLPIKVTKDLVREFHMKNRLKTTGSAACKSSNRFPNTGNPL